MRPRLLKRTSWNIKFGKLMPLMPLQFIIVDSTHPNVHVGMHDLAKPIFWFEVETSVPKIEICYNSLEKHPTQTHLRNLDSFFYALTFTVAYSLE